MMLLLMIHKRKRKNLSLTLKKKIIQVEMPNKYYLWYFGVKRNKKGRENYAEWAVETFFPFVCMKSFHMCFFVVNFFYKLFTKKMKSTNFYTLCVRNEKCPMARECHEKEGGEGWKFWKMSKKDRSKVIGCNLKGPHSL